MFRARIEAAALAASLLLPGLLGAAAPEEDAAFKVGGYLKTYARYQAYDIPSVPSSLAAWDGALRLKASYSGPGLVEAAYVLAPQVSSLPPTSFNTLLTGPDPFSYRLDDLSPRLSRGGEGKSALYQNLDRLSLRVEKGPLDAILGRQAVAFGPGRLVNPTDVLAPFPNQALDTEERVGVDALRVRAATGDFSEVDAGVVAAQGGLKEKGAFYIKPHTKLGKNDVSLMAMRFRENVLLGGDLQSSIGGAGFWLEAANVSPKTMEDDYLRLVSGLDYQLSGRLYGWVEYHFNGAGGNRFAEYARTAMGTAYSQGGVYLLGRQYASVGGSFQVTPLVTFSLQATANLNDSSIQAAPHFEASLTQDLYAELGGYLTFGEAAGFDPMTFASTGSEFQLYPDMAFTALRYYF